MRRRDAISGLDRRSLLLGAANGAALLGLFGVGEAGAQDRPTAGLPADIDGALKALLGDAKPVDGKIMLDIPEIAENGNTVPYTLSVESPMTEEAYVKALHVLAAGNPQPGVASFALSPSAGRAFVSSRMRLARTQDIVAVAELSDGKFLLTRRTVKVTIGGCGG